MLKVSRVKVRQDKRIFENGKFVGDWLDIKSWGTEKVSIYVVFQSQVACGNTFSPFSLEQECIQNMLY